AIQVFAVNGVHMCDFFFSSRRRHTRFSRDWSSDVCSSDLLANRRSPLALNHLPRHPRWMRGMPGTRERPARVAASIFVDDEMLEIGRASCRERAENAMDGGTFRKQRQQAE